MTSTITQYEAQQTMERLGFDVSVRTLTNWRTKGALPVLRRLDGGDGHGAGPTYVWDRGVLLQLHTLLDAMNERAVIEDAMLFAWWAGFEYPIDRMRDIWLHWARSENVGLMRDLPTGDFDPVKERDLIDQLPKMMRQSSRKMREVPETYFDTLVHVYVDPLFAAQDLSPQQTDGLRHDVARLSESHEEPTAEFLAHFAPDNRVRNAVDFIHEYFSPATLPALLENIPGEWLAQAHADWRVLSGVYRWLLQEAIDDLLNGGGGDHKIAQFILLRLFSRLGRAAILCDIALRRLGHGAEVNAFVAKLRQLGDDPDVQRGASTLRRVLTGVTDVPMTEDPDAVRRRTEMFQEIFNENPGIGVVITKVSDAGKDLWDLLPEAIRGAATNT